jgi:hypothetical protein
MAITQGFIQTIQGLQIAKDPEAKLTYTLDWVNWLDQGDSLDTATWTIVARANDPDPLVKVSDGIQGTKTYIELDEGQVGKSYTVFCKIITDNGLEDRRFFKVKVEARSA